MRAVLRGSSSPSYQKRPHPKAANSSRAEQCPGRRPPEAADLIEELARFRGELRRLLRRVARSSMVSSPRLIFIEDLGPGRWVEAVAPPPRSASSRRRSSPPCREGDAGLKQASGTFSNASWARARGAIARLHEESGRRGQSAPAFQDGDLKLLNTPAHGSKYCRWRRRGCPSSFAQLSVLLGGNAETNAAATCCDGLADKYVFSPKGDTGRPRLRWTPNRGVPGSGPLAPLPDVRDLKEY